MWALARSPDPDLALRTVDRLAAADARDRGGVRRRAARATSCLRGRLFALLGGSTALGDHLVTHPDRWRRLTRRRARPVHRRRHPHGHAARGGRRRPRRPARGRPRGRRRGACATGRPSPRCAPPTATSCWCSPPPTSAAVSEPDLPVLPLEEVAAQLADLATAALRAALAVALAEADGDTAATRRGGRLAVIAMGKTRRRGAELRQRRRRRVRRRARRPADHPAGRAG